MNRRGVACSSSNSQRRGIAMSRLLLLAALGVGVLAGPLRSQGPPPRPTGPAPMQQLATFKDGQIVCTLTIPVYRTETFEVEVKGPDGKIRKEKRERAIPQWEKDRKSVV